MNNDLIAAALQLASLAHFDVPSRILGLARAHRPLSLRR
jgi:hypothetical protein